jgi:hypothetical protein
VIRNFAAFLLLGVLFCSSQIAVAQGTSVGSQGGGQAAAQESSSPFDPLPLVKKGDKLVPDLDKMWGSPEMHFTLLKQPSKRNALLAWGGIDVGDSTRFLEAMKAAKPIEEVWLFSPGGSLDEGLEMGRLVHKAKLGTHLLSWMECASACNFIFMGGAVRGIDPGGTFIVHMFSADMASAVLKKVAHSPETFDEFNERYPDHKLGQTDLDAYNEEHGEKLDVPAYLMTMVVDINIKQIQQDSARRASEIARFLTEMGLSLRFLTAFANISNDHPRELSRDELRDFNIINTD